MGLTINRVNETSTSYELGETIWLNADRDTALPDGHPEAAFLLGTAGKRISVEEAERLGLAKGDKKKTKAAEPEADKAAEPEADKESKPEADKADGPELVKDIVARIEEMPDDELKALSKDKRAGVVKARKAELERRKKAAK